MGPRPAADPWTRRGGMAPRRDQAGLMYPVLPLLQAARGWSMEARWPRSPIIASASGRMGLPRPSSGRGAPHLHSACYGRNITT
jgi:hypothetical protein